jgi:hypothetical protein
VTRLSIFLRVGLAVSMIRALAVLPPLRSGIISVEVRVGIDRYASL